MERDDFTFHYRSHFSALHALGFYIRRWTWQTTSLFWDKSWMFFPLFPISSYLPLPSCIFGVKVKVKVKVKSLSRVRLFVTPQTVACQAPPSMGFSRQEYWSGVPFPSPGDLCIPGIEPRSPTLVDRCFNLWATREVFIIPKENNMNSLSNMQCLYLNFLSSTYLLCLFFFFLIHNSVMFTYYFWFHCHFSLF